MENKNLHKQNSLIEITPKNLTSAQRKGFNAFLKFAKRELKVNKKFDQLNDSFEITINEIKDLTGIEGNPLKIFKYLEGLSDKKIVKYENEKKWEIISVIQSISRDQGNIYFSLSNYVYNRLVEADYTTLDLCEMSKLNGKYAITLYEWFLRYKNFKSNGEYYNPKWSLEEFRDKVGATGKTYSEIRYLKNKVIEPAIEELNSKTDLKVSYDLKKEGSRKYTHIQLVLKRNKILNAEIISEIQICETTKGIIDKILKTDLIHINGKRVIRKDLETAVKELNEQHKNPNIIIKSLKKLFKDNNKTVSPKSLKSYIWTIAKSIIVEEKEKERKKVKPNDLQGVEPKIKVKEELTEEIREPINEELKQYKKEIQLIAKGEIKDSKYYEFMGELAKSNTIESLNELVIKYHFKIKCREIEINKIELTGLEKEYLEQHKKDLKKLIMLKLNENKINLEIYGKLIVKITNIKSNSDFNSVMIEIGDID